MSSSDRCVARYGVLFAIAVLVCTVIILLLATPSPGAAAVCGCGAPGLLDIYLARTGFASQQTGKDTRKLPPNLWRPFGGDEGAHGEFDARAHAHSPQSWAPGRAATATPWCPPQWAALPSVGAIVGAARSVSRR